MGIKTHSMEIPCSVSASRMFKAIVDGHNLFPKLKPDEVKSVDILEGHGEAGTIIQINFCAGPFKYIKQRTDFVDVENHIFHYSLIEGDMLADKFEKISHELKFEATSNGGCILKRTIHLHCKGDYELNPEIVKGAKAKDEEMHNTLTSYLTENPEAYA